ncbi:NUDIX domain-containing protein [Bacillus subtilis]|nr:NUDIX domain-containing protein [Bacillus subtilis]
MPAASLRYGLGRWIFELPGGGVEPGETPVAAACREYEEELGLRLADLTHV